MSTRALPAGERRRRLMILGAIVATCAIAVAVAVLATSGGSKRHGAVATATPALLAGIPQHGTVLGDPSAKVTMLEFADLKCPICRDYTLSVLPGVVRDYVRTGKVKIDLQLMAFIGPDSVTAAQFAHGAARQGLMWDVAERFYANQGDERERYADAAFLRRIGAGVPGLDVERALAHRATTQLTATQRLVERYRVTGTPTLVVDGAKLPGIDAATVTAALDASLRR